MSDKSYIFEHILYVSHCFRHTTCIILFNPKPILYEGIIIIYILKMRKLKHREREFKDVAQGHIESEWP